METNTPMQIGIKLHRFFNVLLWMHYNIAQAILLICTSLPGQPKRIMRAGDTEHDHPLSHVHILVVSDEGQVSQCQQQLGQEVIANHVAATVGKVANKGIAAQKGFGDIVLLVLVLVVVGVSDMAHAHVQLVLTCFIVDCNPLMKQIVVNDTVGISLNNVFYREVQLLDVVERVEYGQRDKVISVGMIELKNVTVFAVLFFNQFVTGRVRR